MTDADAIRAVCPRDTMKWLARALGVPLDTARHWLYRKMSAERRREMALRLLAEMDAQDRMLRPVVRAHLEGIVRSSDVEVGGAGGRFAPEQTRGAQNRPETR